MFVCACLPVCVCVQISAISTLRCRCKMLPPWQDPGCCAVFSLSCSSSFCQGHQDQQHQWISLSPLSMLCQHHQRCDTPTPPASARLSLCTSQLSLCEVREMLLWGVQTQSWDFFFFFLCVPISLFLSLFSYPPLPSSSSAQVKALAVWR